MEATGTRLGRYRLVQRIGEGGMGVVHLGLDDAGRAVAVKVLRPHVAGDPHARQRLAREVDTLRRIRHPRVAAVLDADVDCPTPYVVTQYVPAPPLDDHVRATGPLGRLALARLGDGLGEALASIHAAGIVHRDLKPGNVLMLDGDPVVIDFGIAHVADDVRLTSTGLVMGTPGYLSPEVVAGDPVGHATDWWGWAATMAFAASGRPPFGKGPVEVVLDRVRRGEADLDGVPAGLVSVLARGLDVDPSRRPAPGELRQAVADLRSGGAGWSVPAADITQPVPFPPSAPPTPSPSVDDATAPGSDAGSGPATQRFAEVPATRALPAAATEPIATPAPYRAPSPAPAAQTPAPDHRPAPAQWPFGGPPAAVQRTADAAPSWARPPSPRTGTLLAGLAALAAVAAVAPVMAAIIGFAGSVLARTVDRTSGALLRRRHERGPRRGDVAWAVAASPTRLLGAALVSVPAAVLPVLVGISTVFLAGWVLGPVGAAVPGDSLPLAVGAVAAVTTAWWGPGGGSVRRGSRIVVRTIAPGRRGTQVVVAVLAIVVVGAVLVVLGGAPPDWAPLPGPPLGVGS